MDIQKKITDFSTLTQDQQQTKILSILDKLIGKHEIYGKMVEAINTHKPVSSGILIEIYQAMLETTQSSIDKKKSIGTNRLEHIHDYLEKIHQKEDLERQQEQESLESLLDQI